MNLFITILVSIVLISSQHSMAEGSHDDSSGGATRPAADPKASDLDQSSQDESQLAGKLGNLFQMREERALIHARFLLNQLSTENELEIVKDITALTLSLNDEAKKTTLEAVTQLNKDNKSESRSLNILQRVQWVLEELLGKAQGNSSIEKAVKAKVAEAKSGEENRVKEFNDKLEKALSGDEVSKKELLAKYTPATLMDYIGQHNSDPSGTKVAKLMSWQDKNGVNYLDVVTKAPGSEPTAQSEAQTWKLGKEDEDIRTALKNFNEHFLGQSSSTTHQFQRAALNTDPSRLLDRKFVEADTKTGELKSHSPLIIRPEDNKEVCKKEDNTFVKAKETEHRPFYFFRPFPNSDRASYASLVDGVNRNFLKDMNTGFEKGIPGAWDPVPTPDELYMTIPTTNSNSDSLGIKIYAMKDLLNDVADPKPIYEEDTDKFPDQKPLTGVYQSIGELSSDLVSNTYRIITDMNGLSFRDYRVFSVQGTEGKVEPQGKEPKRLCPKLGSNISLPMISKDGRFLSFLDTKDQVTKIYEIGPKGDRCDLVGNLGIATSKVDFSYDKENPKIVFHQFDNQDERETYPEVPSDDLVSNVYMYDLKTRQIARLTNNTDANSIYPAFKRDGTIVYLHHPHGASKGEGGEKSKLVVVDPKKANLQPFDMFDSKITGDPESLARLRALTAIGGLWAELCSPNNSSFSSDSAAMASLGINRKTCQRMVASYWDKFKDSIYAEERWKSIFGEEKDKASLTTENLAKSCLANLNDGGLIGTGTDGSSGVARPRANVPQKCISCHLDQRFFPWDDKAKLNAPNATRRGMSFLDDIADRINQPLLLSDGNINPKHMPLNSELTPAEKKQLEDWIKSMR